MCDVEDKREPSDNVNGSKETTRAHESDGIIDKFVVIGTTGNMIVDRVIKRATRVCNGSRLASTFLLNTANCIHAKRFKELPGCDVSGVQPERVDRGPVSRRDFRRLDNSYSPRRK